MGEQRDFGDENDLHKPLDIKLVWTDAQGNPARDPRLDPVVKYKLTTNDKRFLRRLRICQE